jgi:hypothetical protein
MDIERKIAIVTVAFDYELDKRNRAKQRDIKKQRETIIILFTILTAVIIVLSTNFAKEFNDYRVFTKKMLPLPNTLAVFIIDSMYNPFITFGAAITSYVIERLRLEFKNKHIYLIACSAEDKDLVDFENNGRPNVELQKIINNQ